MLNHFRDVMHALQEGVAIFDDEDRLIECNPQYREMFALIADIIEPGVPFETLLRVAVKRRQNNSAFGNDERWVQQRLEAHRHPSGVFEHHFVDGRRLWVRTRRTETGHTIATYVDITELRQSEERFRRLADAAPQGIAIHHGGVILEANNRLGALLGCDTAELIGFDLSALLAADIDRQAVEQILISEEGTIEGTVRRRDGVAYLAEMSWRAVPYKGRTASVLTIFDITERHELEEQVRQADKLAALGQLAGGIAHDFNNLLTIIDGYTQRALNRLGEPERVSDALAEVRKAADKAASLSRQLLAFGRKDAMARPVTSLRRVLTDIEKLMVPLLGVRYALRIRAPENDLRFEAASGQLEQALINLLINARDAMPAGGELRISAEARAIDEEEARHHHGARAGRYVAISVEDEGVGMSADLKRRLFEPFFTTKEAGRGTGLGLAMVYGMVRSSDGFITVASEQGRGSTFAIHLPLVESPVAAVVDRLDHSVKGQGETVLVVEDNDAVRNLAQDCLTEAGYDVLVASNGLEAIEIDEEYEGTIDLLLTDVVMPVLGGIETALSLKAHRPEIAVLLMTGYPSRGQAKSVEIPREFRVLEKPFDPDVLLRTVREVIVGAAIPSTATQ